MGLIDELEKKDFKSFSWKYCLDIVMVLDVTGGMCPFVDEIKIKAAELINNIPEYFKENGRSIDALRVRIISYRDFKYEREGEEALEKSKFFSFPEESEEFSSYVGGLKAVGGGDEPESGLEALVEAMRSDWVRDGFKRRHVILVFTDSPAVSLMDSSRIINPSYPENMPKNYEELSQMWNGTSQELGGMPEGKAKRMVLFAPDVSPWSDITEKWDNILLLPTVTCGGLNEVDLDFLGRVIEQIT